MPFVSKAQKGWMYAHHQDMAEKWQEHTPKGKKLPEHVGDKPKHKKTALDYFTDLAVGESLAVKLARDLRLDPSLVHDLAARSGASTASFVDTAYQAPGPFVSLLKAASDQGADLPALYQGFLRTSGVKMDKTAGLASNDATLALTGGLSAPFATDTGNRTEAFGRGSLMGMGGTIGAQLGHGLGVSLGGQDAVPMAGGTPKQVLIRQLATLVGGGAGVLGTRALLGKPSWKKPKEEPKVANDMLVKVAEIIQRGMRKKAAAKTMVSFLDTLAARLPLTKAAGVRSIQKDVSAGRPLAQAIKQAYPTLTGEQRGILAHKLCSLACKQAGEGCPAGMRTESRKNWSGPAHAGAAQMHAMS